ncbi:MAG TPA: LPS assembly protein LptD, partial [Candidatus Binataceae bacterium]
MDCFLKLTRNPLLMVAFSAMLFCDARCAFAALASTNNKGGVPPVVRAEHEEPVNVTGRQTTYDSKADTFTVTGDAVMTQGGSVLKADEIVVMRRTRQARATGNVHLVDPDVEIWASQADVDLEKETLVLQNAIIKAKKTTYHLEGQKVVKLEGQNYAVTKGFFTTCGCTKGAPDWSIRADQMDVDIGGTGTAHGASFDVLGHQLFKLPYAIFPADSSRHSGFLTGREGESGLRGIQFLQPYYIAINRSSDATVAFDIESSQRVGGLAEYRLTNGKDDYLWMDGAFYDESLRSNQNRQSDIIDNEVADPHIPLDRYGLFAMTRQHLTDSLTAYGDAISVSDSFYLREMDVWTLSSGFGNNFSSLRDAQSHFGLLDEFEDGFARLQGDWHQDLIQSQDFALQRLPQLQLSGRQELLGDLAYLDYDTEAVNFYRYQGQEGLRFDANPRITVPWRLGEYLWGYGSIGAQGAVYDSSGHTVTVTQAGTPKGPTYNNSLSLGPLPENGFQASGIPYAQAGIATLLEKTYDLNWTSIEKLKHMIEPFVNYAYVPRINQGNLPLFDQIDRVNSRSLFTVGFTTLLFGRMPVSP